MSEAIDCLQKGQIFEVETVKGEKSYLLCHGIFKFDGKVHFTQSGVHRITGMPRHYALTIQQAMQRIASGDLHPKDRREVDMDKFVSASIGMSAMSKGLSGEEYLETLARGEGSEDT